jgi:hypothetical protein
MHFSPEVVIDRISSDDHGTKRNESIVPILPVAIAFHQGGDDKRDDAHELDQDIQRRATRILERISDRVPNNASLVDLCSLSALGTFNLNVFLGIVPRATSYCHHDGEHHTTRNGTGQETCEATGSNKESDRDGRQNGEATGKNHLLDRILPSDSAAFVRVGVCGPFAEIWNLSELPADLDNDAPAAYCTRKSSGENK